jgi:glutathione S-transferase
MITLVTLPPAFGLRNVSPFCLKVEMLLTSLELPFELQEIRNPGKAPRGKVPYLVDDGVTIPDSELITEYLERKTGGRVYAGLSDEQRARGVALARLCEDHLYWLGVASRWLDDHWWPNVVAGFFGFVPAVARPLVAAAARRQVARTYHLHGLGRHTLEEQKGFARRDLEALSATVPGEGFLFGDRPGIFDFTVAGMMAGFYDQQPSSWFTDLAADYPALRDYAERVQSAVGVWGRQ